MLDPEQAWRDSHGFAAATQREHAVCFVRWMQYRRHRRDVLDIEAATSDAPWTAAHLRRVLQQSATYGMVAEHGNRVAGFMVYELHKRRVEVIRLAVHPDYQDAEVYEQMVGKLLGKLSPNRRNVLALWVPDDRLARHQWLRSEGFRAVESAGSEYRFLFRKDGT